MHSAMHPFIMRKLFVILSILCTITLMAQNEVEVVNIENPYVRAYMDDPTYFAEPGTWNTVIYNYKDTTLYSHEFDLMTSHQVTWAPSIRADEIKDIMITVSEEPDFANAMEYYADNIADTAFTVRDLMSDCSYYYKVEEHYFNGQNNVLGKGYFHTDKQTMDYLDWPAGKVATWQRRSPVEELRQLVVSVSEDSTYREAATHYPDLTTTEYTIRNMLPERLYYYKVEEVRKDGKVNVLTNGAFRTEGQVRMIQAPNARNMRDIGGWWSVYGAPIRYGILYRSGALDGLTKNGRHDLADNLKMGAELDLRRESNLTESRLGPQADFLRLIHEAGTKGLTQRKEVYPLDLRWIIKRLDEGKNVNWHCAIGCDRCGTLSFLLEGLLGMSEIDICREYELSGFTKYNRKRSDLKSWFNVIRQFGPKDDLARCFYSYWLSLGMTERELDHFINFALGFPEDHVLDSSEGASDDY